jgi:mRNA-degrading endonuclease YafQ of YafQ-DinJ toxin-antitoxin module
MIRSTTLWQGFRARHITGAWYLLYRQEGSSLTLAAITQALSHV